MWLYCIFDIYIHRKDNINEISLDNSDEDDSTSSGDNIITTGGDIEKSPDPHEIVMNEKSPLKVIKKGNIGNLRLIFVFCIDKVPLMFLLPSFISSCMSKTNESSISISLPVVVSPSTM
jgi:hypothetical protein